jgi:glyoxylase-like metal-dependent hydrolase (beta-lactamase superfamily II)
MRSGLPAKLLFAAGILAVSGLAGRAFGQQQNFDNVEIHVLHVQGKVYLLVGAGGNTTVQVGDDGVLLVDTQFAPLADKIAAKIAELSDLPIRYIVNTHIHPDHTGGNEALAEKGEQLAGANVVGNIGESARSVAAVIAHENMLTRMSRDAPDLPFGALPTDTYFTASKELFFNGEAIEMLHMPNAHTDGDTVVFFRRSDVISTGDIFTTTRYPVVDHERGGSIQGVINALNRLMDIAIAGPTQEGGTLIVPGHGRVCDEADLLEYRDMVTIIRDRIQHMIDDGMTVEQVKASKPTLDYDARYGSDTGFWTTAMFIEAVYRDLKQAGQPK